MCIYNIRKNSIKLSLIIFWTYLQFGCGLKLLKQLSQRHYLRHIYDRTPNFQETTYDSPCPNIFEYRFDPGGALYGYIEIETAKTSYIDLVVEFSLGNRVNKGAEGSISLPYQNQQQIIQNMQNGKPINYRVDFPAWRGVPPRITKIVVNGRDVCIGQSYAINTVPVLTTIYLRNTLTLDQFQYNTQQSNNHEHNINFYLSDGTTKDGSEGVFNVRNDNNANTPGNPYNFNPNNPRTVPEIVVRPEVTNTESTPYSRNPFLNNLSTTSNPNGNINGANTFNQYIPHTATTDTFYPDVRLQDNPTQSPVIRQPSSGDQAWEDTSQYQNDICGRPVVTNSLVLHGQRVPRGAFPWLVAMFVKTNSGLEYHCSATLISKRHVVTASHCLKPDAYRISAEKIVLILGRLNVQGWGAEDGEKIVGVEDYFIHPNYTSRTADADISIIVTKAEITFSRYIRPICLWSDDSDLNHVVGKRGIVVGWGRDETGQKVSPEPKQSELPIVSQEACLRSNYSYSEITSERTFCAGDRKGSGPCNGDSGSGFVMLRNGRWRLKGIVSMSLSDPYTRTCDLYNYVVFTDASKYLDWILNLIK